MCKNKNARFISETEVDISKKLVALASFPQATIEFLATNYFSASSILIHQVGSPIRAHSMKKFRAS